jgi:hypothetical protein
MDFDRRIKKRLAESVYDLMLVLFLSTSTFILAELVLPGLISPLLNINLLVAAFFVCFVIFFALDQPIDETSVWQERYSLLFVLLNIFLIHKLVSLHLIDGLIGLISSLLIIFIITFSLLSIYDRRRNY